MHDSTHTHTQYSNLKAKVSTLRAVVKRVKNLGKKQSALGGLFSILISFLGVALITYGATTIGSNIDTGGNLTVSNNATLGDNATDLIKSIGSFYASSTLQSTGAARFYSTARIDGATTLNSVSYTWPSSDGSASQYLQTNGAGTLSWATVSGGGASPDWNKQTNYGVLNLTASTTIPYWAKDAIYASSTLIVQGLTTLTNASTTQISSTGSAYFATTGGNIGIGTTSPGTLLSLGNTGNDTINILATATSTFGSGINLRTGCFSINGTCVGSGGGSGTVNSGATGQLSYYAGDGTTLTATSSLFINSNQNIGIGTTTPNWLLQVAGTRPFLTLSDTIADTNSRHWFMSSQGGNFYVGTSSDAYATSTYLTITNGGNVGIGSTTPIAPLGLTYTTPANSSNYYGQYINVNSSAATGGNNYGLYVDNNTSGSGTEYGIFGKGVSYGVAGESLSGYAFFGKFTGTNSGSASFLTSSSITSADLSLFRQTSSPFTGNMIFADLADGTGSFTGNFLNFQNNNITQFIVKSNGTTGIGTSTPTTMFQVATSTANATTTMEVGKANQNKGSCLKMYDDAGAVKYVSINGTSFVISATSCE